MEGRGDPPGLKSLPPRTSGGFRRPAEAPKRSRSPAAESGSHTGSALGATNGVTAAGAWAARLEIANLLEGGLSPRRLVEMIRLGREGDRELKLTGEVGEDTLGGDETPKSWSRVTERSRTPIRRSEKREPKTEPLIDPDQMEGIIQDQKAILESLAADATPVAPWTASKEVGRAASSGTGLAMKPVEMKFSKRAPAPSKDAVITSTSGGSNSAEDVVAVNAPEFGKKAKPPPEGVTPGEPSKKGGIPFRMEGGFSHDLAGKEKEDLETFVRDALEVYEDMESVGVQMDISKYVRTGKGIDREKFAFHTTPSRASTGLRYIRVLKGLMSWVEEFDPLPTASNVQALERLKVVEYVEYLIQKGVGYHTPQTLLYALDYFGKAFGFDPTGTVWNRAKRLAVKYAKSKPALTNRAALFSKQTLIALEKMLLNEDFPTVERITAGKLRLCVQAAIRWDDLVHTPLSSLEWIRRRGESAIIGIRAKTTQGKTKARPWVASLMAVDPSNDGWLPCLVKLLVKAHGSSWTTDDHTGKEITRSGVWFTSKPARLGADVIAIKQGLGFYRDEGGDTGMSQKEMELLRWHGAKATFATLMQHLHLDPKTVRLAGDWSSRDESMPETYLREAQLLVIGGQEACLTYLRAGGDFAGLVSEGLAGNMQDDQAPAVDPRRGPGDDPGSGAEILDPSIPEERRAAAIRGIGKYEGVSPAQVAPEFLEGIVEDGGKIPSSHLELEKRLVVDVEKVEEILEDYDPAGDVFVSCSFDREAVKVATVKQEPKDDEGGAVADAREVVESAGEGPDPPLADEEFDPEGLTERYVLLDKPTSASRLHMPAAGKVDAAGLEVPQPRCGAKGTFAFVAAGEAIDPGSEPCVRCFGRRSEGTCKKLCSIKFRHSGKEYRCTEDVPWIARAPASIYAMSTDIEELG
eukprot:s30_g40.t1